MSEMSGTMPEVFINTVRRVGVEYRINRFWVREVGEVIEHFLIVRGWVTDGSVVKFNGRRWRAELSRYDATESLCEIRLDPESLDKPS